jgi:hypothetical protein
MLVVWEGRRREALPIAIKPANGRCPLAAATDTSQNTSRCALNG